MYVHGREGLVVPQTALSNKIESVVNRLDITAVTQFISNVGFPIACVIMLWYRMTEDTKAHKAEMDKMTEALNNNTLAVQHMSDMIATKKVDK